MRRMIVLLVVLMAAAASLAPPSSMSASRKPGFCRLSHPDRASGTSSCPAEAIGCIDSGRALATALARAAVAGARTAICVGEAALHVADFLLKAESSAR